jgi:hypothetical protein
MKSGLLSAIALTTGVVLASAAGAHTFNAARVVAMPDRLITEAQWRWPQPRKCDPVKSCGDWKKYYPKVKSHDGMPVCKMSRSCCTKYYTSSMGSSCKQYGMDCREETQPCPRKIAPRK